jgi:hypothetical protein
VIESGFSHGPLPNPFSAARILGNHFPAKKSTRPPTLSDLRTVTINFGDWLIEISLRNNETISNPLYIGNN